MQTADLKYFSHPFKMRWIQSPAPPIVLGCNNPPAPRASQEPAPPVQWFTSLNAALRGQSAGRPGTGAMPTLQQLVNPVQCEREWTCSKRVGPQL